jgi:acyl-CoA thioesterase-2
MDSRPDELPDLLALKETGPGHYQVFQPSSSAEGRDVVFSGQYLAQMLMASEQAAGGAKAPRSIHAVFARPGTYSKPIELTVDSMQAGRTWASDTVTAEQEGRLLARGIVLLNTTEPDLVRHEPVVTGDVPGPEDLPEGGVTVFPGAEARKVPGEPEHGGVPVEMAWHRFERPLASPAANQAVLVWATCGELIGLAMRPYRNEMDISQAHRTLSTGVIAHTAHFLEPFDVSQWLLIVSEASKAAGGRVYGRGSVHTADGRMVVTFHQDSMLKAAAGALDPGRSM